MLTAAVVFVNIGILTPVAGVATSVVTVQFANTRPNRNGSETVAAEDLAAVAGQQAQHQVHRS
jgi:hypothetical protein